MSSFTREELEDALECEREAMEEVLAERDEARAKLKSALDELMRVHDALHRECDGKADLPAEIRALRDGRRMLEIKAAHLEDELAEAKATSQIHVEAAAKALAERDAALAVLSKSMANRITEKAAQAVAEADRDRFAAEAARSREALAGLLAPLGPGGYLTTPGKPATDVARAALISATSGEWLKANLAEARAARDEECPKCGADCFPVADGGWGDDPDERPPPCPRAECRGGTGKGART